MSAGECSTERGRAREVIRSRVTNTSEGAWGTHDGTEMDAHLVDMQGATALAICNLAEAVDAQGDAIRAAVRSNASAIERNGQRSA